MKEVWQTVTTSKQSKDSFLIVQCIGALPPIPPPGSPPEHLSPSTHPALGEGAFQEKLPVPVLGAFFLSHRVPHSLPPVWPSTFEPRTRWVQNNMANRILPLNPLHPFYPPPSGFPAPCLLVPSASVSTSLGLCLHEGGKKSSCTHRAQKASSCSRAACQQLSDLQLPPQITFHWHGSCPA